MLRPATAILGLCVLASCSSSGAPARPATTPASITTPPAPSYGAAQIDAGLRAAWQKEGLVPAPRSDDATFLRRAWLDIVGNVPPLEATRAFLADTAPDKRAKLVDTLLASPAYADHWTTYWDEVLMGRAAKNPVVVDRVAFRAWLHERLATNTPWDRVVVELVSATGQNGNGGPRKGPAMQLAGAEAPDDEPPLAGAGINGAVNFALRFEQNPQDLGGTASRIFLGVQIQCAQCHDHKTEAWKQEDFRKFSSAFFHQKVAPVDRAKTPGIRRVALVDSATPAPRYTKGAELAPIARAKPTALDGKNLDEGIQTRRALASWVTAKENPWFAKAYVNRMWGHFLGRGFVDPVDDIRPSNPATAPEVLDALAADFAAHGFDPKRLVRIICATEAYGLAADGRAKVDPENKLWARFHLVPLGPEELLNALVRVTDLEDTAQRAGMANLESLRSVVVQKYAFLFDTDEEDDTPDYSGTISQALALLNGALVAQGDRVLPGSTVADVVRGPGDDRAKIETLALRVLGRAPTQAESDRWLAHVTDAKSAPARGEKSKDRTPLARLGRRAGTVSPKEAAYEDLMWAFLNASEFTFNH